MASFHYIIKSGAGKTEDGTLYADNYGHALIQARTKGAVIELRESKEQRTVASRFMRRDLKVKERIVLSQQLAVMLKAGITLTQAFKSLQEESYNKTVNNLIKELLDDVEGGMPFSSALAKHPKSFSTIYCQMVRAAEQTGNLAEILTQLTSQQQKEFELNGKVKGALIYPAIVSTLMIGVIIMVITFVLPRLTGMFSDSSVELPMSTKILMGMSSFMTHYWYLLILILVGLIAGLKFAMRYPGPRLTWDRMKLKIPVLGIFFKKAAMARFAHSFAFLAEAGVPMMEVFKTVQGVMANAVFESEVAAMAKDVENGIPVSTAIRKYKDFPVMIPQLVHVGEQSGDIAGIFQVLGDFFEKEVDQMARNLSTMLEPIIMIVMGGAVAFILVAVLQPIYGLMNGV